jgi:hypothetical protein
MFNFVKACECTIPSTPVNERGFAKPEFVVGSNIDACFHGFHLEKIHWSLPGIRSINRLAAAIVWQATPNVCVECSLNTLRVRRVKWDDDIGLWNM